MVVVTGLNSIGEPMNCRTKHHFYFRLVTVSACLLVASATSVASDEDDLSKESRFEFAASTELRFAEAEMHDGLPGSVDASKLIDEENKSDQFHWFRYGDAASRAVCIKFNPNQPSKLFIDVDRSQKFLAKEIFESDDGEVWFADLTAEHGSFEQTSKQRVRIRFDKESSKWSVATAGIRTGKVSFNGELRDAKLEDRNANGLWFDPEDRLFVDFDGNGKISRLTERIPAQGMRKIRGRVYGIAGSVSGESVSLAEVTGSGFLVPTIQLFDEDATVTSVSGQLGSNTGMGISIESIDEPVEVPVGDWRVDHLRVEVTSEEGVFVFMFSSKSIGDMVSIGDDDKKEFELLGELKLSSDVSVVRKKAESTLILTPEVTSASGCYLIGSTKGKQSANNENRLLAFSSSPQRELKAGSSGFS